MKQTTTRPRLVLESDTVVMMTMMMMNGRWTVWIKGRRMTMFFWKAETEATTAWPVLARQNHGNLLVVLLREAADRKIESSFWPPRPSHFS
jgi:hypothetical protein